MSFDEWASKGLVCPVCGYFTEADVKAAFQAGADSRNDEVDEFLRQLEAHRQAWKKFGEEQRQLRAELANTASVGGRLALELECLLLDTKDLAVVSKWWDTGLEAVEEWRKMVNK